MCRDVFLCVFRSRIFPKIQKEQENYHPDLSQTNLTNKLYETRSGFNRYSKVPQTFIQLNPYEFW